MRIGFGKSVSVKKIPSKGNEDNNITFTNKVYSIGVRVAAIAIFILALPVTVLLLGIGCVSTVYSKSHGQIFGLYNGKRKQVRHKDDKKENLEKHSKSADVINKHDIIPVFHPKTPEDKAAIIIQKCIRGYLARKPLLSCNLYPQYKDQCEKTKGPESHSIPQADGGKTTVYLPKEMPEVVLKSSGRKDAITRFHQMQEVRTILSSQNSSCLIIPKANLCQDFLVEQRLPINVDSYHNMGLYLSQPQMFDQAVREMTRLFSKIFLSDFVSYQNNPLGHIDGVGDFIRYDNLPLYIVEKNGKKEGKIGLIDLEHIQNRPSSEGLETLVRIFPFHLDIIKEEAKNLKMKINDKSLNASVEKGKKYLQVGFSNHLEWLKQKDVSTNIAAQPFEISLQRANELTNLIEKELLKLNQGINDLFVKKGYADKPQKNFLTENPEEMAKELAANISPLIIGNIKAQIEKKQNKQLGKLSGEFMTESELVSLRSPVLKRPKLRKGVDRLISKNQKIKFEKNGSYEKRDIADQLVYVVIEELVKGGEIFFFDPAYYTGGHDLCWVRY